MIAKKRILTAALQTLCLALSAQTGFAAEGVKVTGIFSDLHYNEQGDDLLGTEIFIVYAGDGNYAAFIQCWAGGTTPPLVRPVQVVGDEVTFVVPAPSVGQGEYRGHISRGGFDGVRRHALVGGGEQDEPIHLPRKTSYWE